jgi:protein-disulfide isomerase
MRYFFLFPVLAALVAGAPQDGASQKPKAMGNPMAAITIELYSDYQCPACKQLHDTTLHSVIEDYVKKGKVYLVHREFPLPMHQYGRTAAIIAEAAHRIGKYEQVGDALFRDQDTWSKTGNLDATLATVLNPEELKKVHALTKDPSVLAEVDREVEMGKKENVQQTPTMVITKMIRRYPIGGVVSYDILRKFLDEIATK